jgi:cytochrome c-type biogenesis protein CcmH/NrfG
MSIDQVSANENHWTELEIELAASLPDREVEHLVAELRDELERNPQISISTETKPERASRRSV